MQRLFLILLIFINSNSSFGQVDKRISLIHSKISNINNAITPEYCSFKIKKITNNDFLKISNEEQGIEQELLGYYDKEQIQLITYDIIKFPYVNTIAYYFSNASIISALEVQQILPNSSNDSIGTISKRVYSSIYYFDKGNIFRKEINGKKIFLTSKSILTDKIIHSDVKRFIDLLKK